MFNKKTAVISGGAEGIGFSIAKSLGQQGMNIVLGDIDESQLAKAESQLKQDGIDVLALKMDVTDINQWKNVADQAIKRFGKIHMLVNNAGVGSDPGPIEATNNKDWQWVIDVNLMGVVNGAHAIIPLIKEHGEGGWMINVASMAGMGGAPYLGSYTATKVAVVGMSEAWHGELQSNNIHVSVLCPGFVKTRIHLSQRNRQDQYKDSSNQESTNNENSIDNKAKEFVENGISVDLIGPRVVEALEAGELYIFTHPAYRDYLQQRSNAIDAAFERAAKSPILEGIDEDVTASFV